MKVDTFGITMAILIAGFLNSCAQTGSIPPVRMTDSIYLYEYGSKTYVCDITKEPMCTKRKELP